MDGAPTFYSQTIDVTVTANTISYTNVAMDRVRSTPPEVLSYSPMMESETDSINCTTPIVINFNWDMDVESVREAFSIEPAVEGEITFEDSQYRMVFTPNRPYEVATRYTVTIDKSAKHPGNLSMEEDFSFSFLTQGRNQLKLLASSPAEGGVVHYTKPTLEVRFDNVRFEESTTWCDTDPDTGRCVTTERTILDAQGNRFTVRTASTCEYAKEPVPSGTGSLIGIIDYFAGKYTLHVCNRGIVFPTAAALPTACP